MRSASALGMRARVATPVAATTSGGRRSASTKRTRSGGFAVLDRSALFAGVLHWGPANAGVHGGQAVPLPASAKQRVHSHPTSRCGGGLPSVAAAGFAAGHRSRSGRSDPTALRCMGGWDA